MKFNNKLTKILSILLLLLMSFFMVGCDEVSTSTDPDSDISIGNDIKDEIEKEEEVPVDKEEEATTDSTVEVTGNLEVHYIDVGQGDAILIKQGKASMLIDAGDNAYGKTVVNYLKSKDISHLDYVIGSHPHADHIGGLDDVINTFSIGKVIMPKVNHTTKTFEDVILAIKNKDLKITTPVVGDIYEIGEASFTILAPNSESYVNLNDYSVIAKLVHGENSFIFTGDAEETSEGEAISNDQDLKADVLKVGHHGSDTSTSSKFLDAVDPKYAVIQVGKENKYGHPVEATLKKLQDKKIDIYRNDLSGNIIAISDGKTIKFNIKPSETVEPSTNSSGGPAMKSSVPSPKAPTPPTIASLKLSPTNISEQKYIGNINSNILHKPDCSSLPKENNRMYFNAKEEGISSGYRACKRCNP